MSSIFFAWLMQPIDNNQNKRKYLHKYSFRVKNTPQKHLTKLLYCSILVEQ